MVLTLALPSHSSPSPVQLSLAVFCISPIGTKSDPISLMTTLPSSWPPRWLATIMEKAPSVVPRNSPLGHILTNWKQFNLDHLKRKKIVFFCNAAQLQYSLGDWKKWPKNSSLTFNTILQLDLFYKHTSKWLEIPHARAFVRAKLWESCCVCVASLSNLTSYPPSFDHPPLFCPLLIWLLEPSSTKFSPCHSILLAESLPNLPTP